MVVARENIAVGAIGEEEVGCELILCENLSTVGHGTDVSIVTNSPSKMEDSIL